MTPLEAKVLFDANGNKPILVRTKSGAEYWLCEDCVDVGSDEYTSAAVYGRRANGTRGGPFHRRTQGEVRWFWLKNVTPVPNGD